MAPIKPNWKVIFKKLRNCTFLSPKYRQLVYQITTNSVIDGVKLHTINPLKGICPHCGIVASTHHMLMECPHIKSIWYIIDQLESTHWSVTTNQWSMIRGYFSIVAREDPRVNLRHAASLAFQTSQKDCHRCMPKVASIPGDPLVQTSGYLLK